MELLGSIINGVAARRARAYEEVFAPMILRFALSLACVASSSLAQVAYVDVGEERGLTGYRMAKGHAGGLAAADYDDDGDIDLFLPTAEGRANLLFENQGDGSFVERAQSVGLASMGAARAALFLDFDADGRLDLLVAGDCFSPDQGCAGQLLTLYRQLADGTFVDVTEQAGLDSLLELEAGMHVGGMAAGELNGDGFLDVFVGMWSGPNLLLINDRAGGFIDKTDDSGLGSVQDDNWQPVILDANGDGLNDIFAAVDFTPNRLWLNRGDGTFEDVASEAGVDTAWNDMGVALGDFDNDADLDIFVSEIFDIDRHNAFFRNNTRDGEASFTESAVEHGIDWSGFAWGCTFLDADRDGWLDLAVTNGWANGVGYDDPSRLFHNTGGANPVFEDWSELSGFDDTDWSSGLIAIDADRDGDLDLVHVVNLLTPPPTHAAKFDVPPLARLWDCEPIGDPSSNGYLVVRPRMPGANTRAIGAIVRVEAGDLRMMRPIMAGASTLSQEPAEAFFGLGSAKVARVTVEWPDGQVTVIDDVAPNQVLDVVSEGCSAQLDLDGDGDGDADDLFRFLDLYVAGSIRADLDGDNDVDRDDFEVLIELFIAGC